MEWLAGVAPRHRRHGRRCRTCVIDKLPAAFLGLLRGGAFSVDGILFCQFLLAALAVLPATLCMGGVLPLTVRVVARSARVGRPRRRHRLLAQHARRHRRLVRRRLRRPARRRPAARPRHRRRHSPSCSPSTLLVAARPNAQALRRRRAPAGRRARLHPRAAALEPAPLLGGPLPRLDRQGHHRVEQVGAARAGLLPRRHRHHGLRRAVAAHRRAQEQRQGRRLERRRHGDADHGRPHAASSSGTRRIPTPTSKPRAAVVGFGSGVTAGAITQFPMRTPTSSSSSRRSSRRGSRFFGPWNHHPVEDPHVRVIVGDGRNFLTQRRTSTTSSSASRRTRGSPACRTCSPRLLEAGARPPRRRRRLLPVGAALRDVAVEHQDHLCSRSPRCSRTPTSSPPRICRRTPSSSPPIIRCRSTCTRSSRGFADRDARKELKRGGVESAEDVIAYLLLTPDEIPAFTAGSPLNTDDNAHHRVRARRAICSADAHRRSVPGARLRHRVALRPLRSLPRRPRRRRREVEDRAAAVALAARARQARRRRSLPRRRQAPRRAAGHARGAAGRARSASARPTIARSRSPTAADDPTGPRRARSAEAAGQGARPTTSRSSARCVRAPGRTRSWRCAPGPRRTSTRAAAICSCCSATSCTRPTSTTSPAIA